MTSTRGSSFSEGAFQAATQHFPQEEFAIRLLMGRSEAFCDMCEELAEAEIALGKVDRLPLDLSEARRREWSELINRLLDEIAAALRQSQAGRSRKGREQGER